MVFRRPGLLAAIVVFGAVALGCSARKARLEEEPERQTPTNAWFMQQRMSGTAKVPGGARERALQEARAAAQNRAAAGGVSSAPGVWVPAGPTNIGGRVTALALDPNNVNHIWAGAAAGGVLHSTDAGTTWTPVFDSVPLLPVGAIATHPTDSNTVYVGTGEANGAGYSYDGDGVFKTINGGATWTALGLAESKRIGRIAIDPVTPDRVFVAATGDVYTPDSFRGVYRSTNGGASWTRVLFVANTAGAVDLAIDPSNTNRIFAAIWEHYSTPTAWIAGGTNSGLWRSQDGGDTWTRLTSGLPAASPTVGRIGIAIAASSPSTVYALYLNDPGNLIGVYKSTNSGNTWARVDPVGGPLQTFNGGYGYYFAQIRVDPADANRVFALDVYWAISTNGGANWTVRTSGLHVDHHDLLITPGRLIMGNDGGIYTSTNGGTNWTKSPNLFISQFYDLGIDPVNPLNRYGGLQDNGSVRTTTGGQSNWTSVNGGDGFHCEVDPIAPLRVYCESQYGNIVRSSNGGASFSSGVSGISPSDRTNWNAPIVHDPAQTQRLYTGTYRVYRSTNGAANWTAISADLSNGQPIAAEGEAGGIPDRSGRAHLASTVDGTVTTIAVSPLDGNILWVGTDDGNVWVTTNQGGAWTQVDVPGRTEWVTRVEADPFSSQSAYATFSGYRNGSKQPRVFRTTNLGNTWTDIGGDLPDAPVNCLNADPLWLGRLFACTDIGVYVTDDWGVSWLPMDGGMPPIVVHDLDLVPSPRTLFAGTHARSMYSYSLTQLPPPDRDGDGTINVLDCAPDDGGAFAVPAEVTGLIVAPDEQTLSWSVLSPNAGSGTSYQVVRGIAGEWPVGSGGSESCLETGTPALSGSDSSLPPAGSAFWYLVRAKNSCGNGGYGLTSAGGPRPATACP